MSSDSSATTDRSRTAVSPSPSRIPRSPAASPSRMPRAAPRPLVVKSENSPISPPASPSNIPRPLRYVSNTSSNGSKSAQTTPIPPSKSRSGKIVRQLLNANEQFWSTQGGATTSGTKQGPPSPSPSTLSLLRRVSTPNATPRLRSKIPRGRSSRPNSSIDEDWDLSDGDETMTFAGRSDDENGDAGDEEEESESTSAVVNRAQAKLADTLASWSVPPTALIQQIHNLMKKYGSKLLDAQDAAKELKKPRELHRAVMEQAEREKMRMDAVWEECFAACKFASIDIEEMLTDIDVNFADYHPLPSPVVV
ncbi:hypothetical protein BJ742DRAFT_772868 [Cladochytrium replicatum]|nr:hypothetical protein BJ742DRAFT_772868 [Cladochytrium replicatum]